MSDEATAANHPVPTMATAAMLRSAAWLLSLELVSEPTEGLMERIRDGRFSVEAIALGSWLGDQNPFPEHVPSQKIATSRAKRVPLDEDLRRMRADHARIFPDGTGLDPAWFTAQSAACDAEAQAWGEGENERARTLRREQFESLQPHLEALTGWCSTMDERTGELLGKIFARTVAAHLSIESGRDVVGLLFQLPAGAIPLQP